MDHIIRQMGLFCILAIVLGLPLYGADIFYSQNGGGSGANCSSTLSLAQLNTSTNWTGPNVLHLCGTFTAATPNTNGINSQGSGTSGNPITIKFETGAIMQSPAWATAINITHNFITVDGGTNGIIQNTLMGSNGGACLGGPCSICQTANGCATNQSASTGVSSTGSNTIIKNLTVRNIFLHVAGSDSVTEDGTTGIGVSGANGRITQCSVKEVYSGIGFGLGGDNIEIDHNTIDQANHGITAGLNSGNVNGVKIHDNEITGMTHWDDHASGCSGCSGNRYHHNGIFTFGDPAGDFPSMKIYNNYLHGVYSHDTIYGDTHTTSVMFIEFACTGCMIFNNVFALDDNPADTANLNYPANGYIAPGPASGMIIVNNTIFAPTNREAGTCTGAGAQPNYRMENNICEVQAAFAVNGGTGHGQIIDYDIYYQNAAGFVLDGFIQSFATWQGAGFDTHPGSGLGNNNPLMNNPTSGDFTLQASSPVKGTVANLNAAPISLGITELNTGAPQTFGVGGTCGTGCLPRASSGTNNWDGGAYPFTSVSVTPTSLGPWTITQVINRTLTASGFTGTVTWSFVTGTTPNGLGGTCITGTTGNTCTLAGTLSAVGTFPFTIRATDGVNTVNTPYTVIVNAAPQINPICPLPAGIVNVSYNATGSGILTNINGTAPFTWSLALGLLPNGLSISGVSIIGTPLAVGTSLFTLKVTDTNGISGTEPCSLTISGVGTPASGGPISGFVTGSVLH